MSTPGAVNPVNLIQNIAPVARQADAAAPDVPFNQVLSREIADRRGADKDAGANQAQPNAPVRQGTAPGTAKAADAGENKAAVPPQDDDELAVDAASAEMLALVGSMVLAAERAVDPSVPADPAGATAPGPDAARPTAELTELDPTGRGRMARGSAQVQAAIPAEAKVPVDEIAPETDPADAPGKPALPEPAMSKRPENVAQSEPAAVKGLPTQASATAELKAAPQASAPTQPPAKSDPGVNPPAQSSGVRQMTAAVPSAAPAEQPVKTRPMNPGARDTASGKPIEAESAAAVKPAPTANSAAKPAEAVKPGASPAVEFTPVRAQEAAAPAAAANPAAMQGQIQQAAAFAPEAVTGHASEKLSPRVGTPGWDQALGQKVVWMVAGGVQSASMTLNPPDLGPLQVVLSVSNSQASATFTAAQPEVRQALEASMPRLREMLAESGIQLGQSTVSAGTQNQYSGPNEQPQPTARQFSQAAPTADAAILNQPPVTPRAGANGLVDTFA